MKVQPANVERSFQRSIMLMVSAASLVLADAEDATLPAALTPLVAVFSYFLIERQRRIRLPVSAANVLGAIAFMAAAWEFSGNTLLGKLLSGAHLLVYITWVVLLLQKGIRQYWWLAALSVLQLAVASVLTTSGVFGASLVAMLALTLWTLSVFTLYRGRIRVAQSFSTDEGSLNTEDSLADEELRDSPVSVRHGLQVDSSEPWIGWRFRSIVGFAFAASLSVAIVTFLVFPRVWLANSPLAGLTPPRSEALISQTGFTEDVQLGEIGQIMQTEGRVLQFDIKDIRTAEPVTPEAFVDAMRMDEILFRGNALGHYDKGRWSTGESERNGFDDRPSGDGFYQEPGDSDFSLRILQDPPIGRFIFAPAPVTTAKTENRNLRIGRRVHTSSLNVSQREVSRSRNRQLEANAAVTFEVWCRAAVAEQRYHTPDRSTGNSRDVRGVVHQIERSVRRKLWQQQYAYNWCLNPDLETSLPKLSQVAKEVCTENSEPVSQRESIQRIFQYLNTSGRFQYSLRNTIQDSQIDPVEDFLINRRTGHCEYFASAGALMLQAVGVPARVVNGYKGYEANSVSGRYEVKQKHAHTWLEAFIDGHWETIDPTPAAAREQEVSKTSQLEWWKDLALVFGDSWRELIQRMSPQRQEAMARPFLLAIKEKWETIRQQGVWSLLKEFWTEIVMHPELWFSPTTGVITFVVLLIIGLIIQRNPLTWFKRKLQDWLQPGTQQERSVVRFYENFRDVCRKHGLPLPENQTAQENALMAQQHFAAALKTDVDAALPQRIATAFNRVRFGQVTLSTEDITALRSDVARLGEVLKMHMQA